MPVCVPMASERGEVTLSDQVLISSSALFFSDQHGSVKLERQQGNEYRMGTHRTVMPPVVCLFMFICEIEVRCQVQESVQGCRLLQTIMVSDLEPKY